MLATSKYIMHGSSTRCTFCNKPFCFRDGYVELTVSTSVQNFVRTTPRKLSFVCSIPPRLQVLRRHIQPNHRLLFVDHHK